jgi:hypothetical protein
MPNQTHELTELLHVFWREQKTPSFPVRYYVGLVCYSNGQLAIEQEITCALTEYVVLLGHFSMVN